MAALIAALAVLFSATPLLGATIDIVRASDADPYTQAEASLREHLSHDGNQLQSFTIKEVAQKGIAQALGQPDMVVAIGTSAARWLHKQLPPSVRLVYCMVNNAQDSGLNEGHDAIGVSTDVEIDQQVSLIAEALPNARAIGMLYRSDSAEGMNALKLIRSRLPGGWHIEPVAVNDSASIADAINILTQKNIDLIWTTADQKIYDGAAVRTLLLSAVRAKIPVWGFSPAFVRAGALLGVGVDPKSQGTQAAELVDRALADPKNAASGVRPPREFQIAINLIVAEQLGISIPQSLSSRATYLYQAEK
jgi:ABC-type uncharacterized transport system substrate-binding protein